MKNWLVFSVLLSLGFDLAAQGFQLIDRQETIQAGLNEAVRIPIKIRNTSEKAQFYIIKKTSGDLGGSQKGFFCLDKNCLDQGIEEFSKRVEAGETLDRLVYVLESGLQASHITLKFDVFVKGKPNETQEQMVNVMVEEKQNRSLVFDSKEISVRDVFPNPVQHEAFVEYQLHQDHIKAKMVIHNILGKPMGEYEMPYHESKIKVLAEDLASGIYFFTIYLDGNGVATRKMIVRK